MPAWVTLALTLPQADDAWLTAFAAGFADLAASSGVRLVGGDLTRGPLSITVQAHGLVPVGAALRRSGARPGDLVCVSGTLGDAGLALRRLYASQGTIDDALRRRLERPTPRLALGRALRGAASSAIDLSDGLVSDLGHILAASGTGAEIDLARLPLSDAVASEVQRTGDWDLPLAAGDDYELCFSVPAELADRLPGLADAGRSQIAVIGTIQRRAGLRFKRPGGGDWTPREGGYDHFSA
jgi:thiamine-monophosphate kinase